MDAEDVFLIFLHGFNSSSQSHKARQTIDYLKARGMGDRIAVPDLDNEAAKAIQQVQKIIEQPRPYPVALIGSSLGGFYATWLAERYGLRAALINPAVRPHERFPEYIGPQKKFYSGEIWELTMDHIEQLRAHDCERLHPEQYLLLVTTGDEVLDYRQAVEKYEGAARIIRQGGDHSFHEYQAMLPLIVDFLAGRDIDPGLFL